MTGYVLLCVGLFYVVALADVTTNSSTGKSQKAHRGMLCFRIDHHGNVVPDMEDRHPVSAAYNMDKMKRGRKKRKPADLLSSVMAQLAAEKPRMYGGSVVALNGDTSLPKDDGRFDGIQSNEAELSSRKKRQVAVQNHEVELLLIVDYPLYLFWLKRNSFVPKRAKDEIIDFYANIINAANRRYETLTAAAFTATLVINGFIIADTPNKTPWTQLLNDSNTIDTDMALDNFTLWVQRNIASLPPHDHALTLSGFDLTRNGRAGLVGLAFQNGSCTRFSQSIVEALKTQETATLVAHEIGHSLGAGHDGDNNNCPNDNKHVMSTSISIPDRDKSSNPWIFSSCSRARILDYIGRRTNGCTLRRDGTPQNLAPYLVQPFGQKYPADIQCEIYLGDQSKFCRTVYNRGGRIFDDMCHSLYCLNSTSNRCFPTLAHDGTTCGNRKWCMSGLCVVSQLAPKTPRNCPAGDDPDARCTQFDCRNATIANGICCGTCGLLASRTPHPTPYRPPHAHPPPTFNTPFPQFPPFGQNFFDKPRFQFPPQQPIPPYRPQPVRPPRGRPPPRRPPPRRPPNSGPFRPAPRQPFQGFFNFGFNDNSFDNSFNTFFDVFSRNLNFFRRK